MEKLYLGQGKGHQCSKKTAVTNLIKHAEELGDVSCDQVTSGMNTEM